MIDSISQNLVYHCLSLSHFLRSAHDTSVKSVQQIKRYDGT